MNRKAANRRLWSHVRHLPGGEETLRDMVAQLHQQDGTAKDLVGTDEYTSTRRLTDAQFMRLIERVQEKVDWPKARRSREGNVAYLVTEGTREYIRFMAGALKFTGEAFDAFVARQTKGKGLKTRRAASAVIEPLERMMRARGWTATEAKGRKWWDPPREEETGG